MQNKNPLVVQFCTTVYSSAGWLTHYHVLLLSG